MIKINEKLTIFHDDNGTFVDGSNYLCSYTKDSANIDYDGDEDYMYIGFYKPINCLYIDFIKANNQALTLTTEYYNGTEFTDLHLLHDDTNFMQRSGFLSWARNQENETATTVNGVELFWYRFNLIGAVHQFDVNGINIVFADDNDLKREFWEINQFLPDGKQSFISIHEACRDEIIQTLNQKASNVTDATTGWEKDISAFDLLEVSQVKLASTYLALSKIMMNVSDRVDDIYMDKSSIYRSKYNDIINNMTINIDHDDDGLYDRKERNIFNYGTIKRV